MNILKKFPKPFTSINDIVISCRGKYDLEGQKFPWPSFGRESQIFEDSFMRRLKRALQQWASVVNKLYLFTDPENINLELPSSHRISLFYLTAIVLPFFDLFDCPYSGRPHGQGQIKKLRHIKRSPVGLEMKVYIYIHTYRCPSSNTALVQYCFNITRHKYLEVTPTW